MNHGKKIKSYCSRSEVTRTILKNFLLCSKNKGFTPVKSTTPNHKRYLTGFTLIEILIASAIFAVILIIATATLGQSSDFRTRLRMMRETSEESRKLADELTRDIHAADAPATVTAQNGGTSTNYSFKNGLAELYCTSSSVCVLTDSTIPSVQSVLIDNMNIAFGATNGSYTTFSNFNIFSYANTLVVSTKDEYRIYTEGAVTDPNDSSKTVNGIFYKSYPHGQVPNGALVGDTVTQSTIAVIVGQPGNLITSTDVEMSIVFGGFCQDDVTNITYPSQKQQAYVMFYIASETPGYSSSTANKGYQTHILSSATSTSYSY